MPKIDSVAVAVWLTILLVRVFYFNRSLLRLGVTAAGGPEQYALFGRQGQRNYLSLLVLGDPRPEVAALRREALRNLVFVLLSVPLGLVPAALVEMLFTGHVGVLAWYWSGVGLANVIWAVLEWRREPPEYPRAVLVAAVVIGLGFIVFGLPT